MCRSIVFVACVAVHVTAAFAGPVTIGVKFDATLQPEPYSGRVYAVLVASGGDARREPKSMIGQWFDPPATYATDVAGVAPGGTVTIDAPSLWLRHELAAVPPGSYRVQAAARRSLDSPRPGRGPGDLYSDVATLVVPESGGASVELTLSHVVPDEPLPAGTDTVKFVEMVSPSLSAFHGREYRIRAGVCLPRGWTDDPRETHPVVYSVTGFGGNHRSALRADRLVPEDASVVPIIVVPDATCYRGHSVFADSANNGPWGRALVEELIPYVEARFHGAGPEHRYVTGGSSGGWSSLWLQVTYPEVFAGVWSHCPDPVDFRDFQRINLYTPHPPGSNMYHDDTGDRRPLARRGDQVMLWYDDFCRTERIAGPGGQIHSFEAVFSPRGSNGEPMPLFDWTTGDVDPAVAKAWEAYDIRLIIERNWATLGPKLAGKLHVYAGEVDTFYLEGAVRLLIESLDGLHSDAETSVVPGMAHSIHQDGNRAMFETIARRWRAAHGG